ncbi:hypothetical protein [Nautilia lithotrophica]
MNKKLLILLSIVLLLITLNIINLYVKSQKELQSQYQNYLLINNKVNQILSLKKKYSNNALKILTSICIIKDNQITCNNLSKSDLRKINYFLKSNIKIKKFNLLKKDNKYIFYAEIIK